jgi:hypothetical protein
MIKLKHLISENDGTNEDPHIKHLASDLQVKTLLNSYFSNAYKLKLINHVGIFRSVRSYRGDYFIVDRSKKERISRDTNNFYTVLMDILPSWKSYPKRSNSVIALVKLKDDVNQAKMDLSYYGDNLYYVFPKNGAKIAVANNTDIFSSFKLIDTRFETTLWNWNEGFSGFVVNFLKKEQLISVDNGFTSSNINDFLNKLQKHVTKEKFVEYLTYVGSWPFISNTRKDIEQNFNGDWVEYFDELLNPEKNGFKLVSIDDLQSVQSLTYGFEIWTDAPCLLLTTEKNGKVYV